MKNDSFGLGFLCGVLVMLGCSYTLHLISDKQCRRSYDVYACKMVVTFSPVTP